MCSEYSLHITKVICVSFFRTTRVLKKGIQMAISSIHFAPGHSGYFDHNSREAHTNNAIFKDEKNVLKAIRQIWVLISKNILACDLYNPFTTETVIWVNDGSKAQGVI